MHGRIRGNISSARKPAKTCTRQSIFILFLFFNYNFISNQDSIYDSSIFGVLIFNFIIQFHQPVNISSTDRGQTFSLVGIWSKLMQSIHFFHKPKMLSKNKSLNQSTRLSRFVGNTNWKQNYSTVVKKIEPPVKIRLPTQS